MTLFDIENAANFDELFAIAEEVGYAHKYFNEQDYRRIILDEIMDMFNDGYELVEIIEYISALPYGSDYYVCHDDYGWFACNYTDQAHLTTLLILFCEEKGIIERLDDVAYINATADYNETDLNEIDEFFFSLKVVSNNKENDSDLYEF